MGIKELIEKGFTKKQVEIARKLAKEAYHNRTGRNADEDPNWWEWLQLDDEERAALTHEYTQRVIGYQQMGFSMNEIMNRDFLADDERWEEAKKNYDERNRPI